MVIKESMACCLPIVSVDVGDVKARIESIDNCFLVAQNPQSIAEKIRYIIENKVEHTNGLDVLKQQGIDYLSVVEKVEKVYDSAINLFQR
jgi:glycosyltransferase involved in cell wall biosynthesis